MDRSAAARPAGKAGKLVVPEAAAASLKAREEVRVEAREVRVKAREVRVEARVEAREEAVEVRV